MYLAEPNKKKATTEGSGALMEFAAAEMQGWRRTMEDAHVTELSFAGDPNAALFAVFDGHGGTEL